MPHSRFEDDFLVVGFVPKELMAELSGSFRAYSELSVACFDLFSPAEMEHAEAERHQSRCKTHHFRHW